LRVLTSESHFFFQLGVLQAAVSLFGNELLLTSVLTCLIASLLTVMLTLEPALKLFNFLPRGLMLASLFVLGTVTLKTRLSHALGNVDDVSRALLPHCYSQRYFYFEKGSRMLRVTQNSLTRGGASYTSVRKRRFWNAIPACVLRRNFRKGVPSQNTAGYSTMKEVA
jgi:hypothetical protein